MNLIFNTALYGLFCSINLISCDSSKESKLKKHSPRVKNMSELDHPKNGADFTIGDHIGFSISAISENIKIDSFEIKHDALRLLLVDDKWDTGKQNPGKKQLSVSVYLSNGKVEKKRLTLTLRSEITPVKYTYRVINTFPHATDAFTQGLFVDGGRMFESTGQKGFSSLRETDLKTGKVKRSINIPSQYFGEGISAVGNEIYFLTWKSHQGIVFDKETFKEIRKFSYPTEGWGLTNKNDTLIMSDGTNILRYVDLESLSEISRIEVYDQNGPITSLNELEYVNGEILANCWQSHIIYIIDAQTGKVNGTLDLTGLFDFANYKERIDVLNGIAYDNESGKYFITGKYWPFLYEIQLILREDV